MIKVPWNMKWMNDMDAGNTTSTYTQDLEETMTGDTDLMQPCPPLMILLLL
jgi:hypothetical protein